MRNGFVVIEALRIAVPERYVSHDAFKPPRYRGYLYLRLRQQRQAPFLERHLISTHFQSIGTQESEKIPPTLFQFCFKFGELLYRYLFLLIKNLCNAFDFLNLGSLGLRIDEPRSEQAHNLHSASTYSQYHFLKSRCWNRRFGKLRAV